MMRNPLSARSPSPALPAWRRLALVLVMALLSSVLGACATLQPPAFPDPLRAPKAEAEAEALPGDEAATRGRPRVESGPTIETAPVRTVDRRKLPPMKSSEPVALTLDGVTLSAFINEVFGTQLGFSLDVDPAVRSRQELVSLRLVDPEPPHRLYVIAEEVLKRYQINITEAEGGVLRFAPGSADDVEPARLITGRALPDVPAGERPVFVAMPLDITEPGRITAQVRNLLGANAGVTLTEMLESNAVLISGRPTAVQATMEAIALLDRASLRDKKSLRINPLYLGADVLAKELTDVLQAQGYSVRQGTGGSGALTFVPVTSANALLIFSESDPALAAAAEWAERLDQPSDENAGDGGVYLYFARHTTVESLLPVLQALVGGTGAGGNPLAGGAAAATTSGSTSTRPAAGSGGARGGNSATVMGGVGGQLAVDPIRNVIVFQGEAQKWRAVQGVLARLDQPARQVVIEVTIAEVTLTDEFEHGVEWALRNVGVSNFTGPIGFNTGSEPNSGGVVWSPISSSGQVRAVMNLFAQDSRVSILSTPRLMVKSGESASIDVGTEVPIITSQATAVDLPTTPGNGSSILQQVQYRKTGVLLEIDAVVHSGQRVDLKVAQEVSEATQTDTSDISSPSIFSRRLETSLSLSDGESMLLGGLISNSTTQSKSKVPGLGDIPVVGKLFQSASDTETRTELLMLITPYVIEDASQARAITDAVRARFEAGER
jgi:general secretion pathway protein D